MSAMTAISTSQRYASTESMMRFSMAAPAAPASPALPASPASLALLERGLQELRLENEAALDHNLLTAFEPFEDRRLPVMGLGNLHRPNRESIRRGAHEDDILAVNLLQGV